MMMMMMTILVVFWLTSEKFSRTRLVHVLAIQALEPGATKSVAVCGGVVKYLKARTIGEEASGDNGLGSNDSSKERKLDVWGIEYKNFSG